MDIRGIYKHFKGGKYEVIGKALEHGTGKEYVLYKHLNDPLDFWIRPKKMFFGKKNVNGIRVSRFTKISDVSTGSLKNIDMSKILIFHSEIEKLYKIIGVKDGYFIIDEADLDLILYDINSLLELIEKNSKIRIKNWVIKLKKIEIIDNLLQWLIRKYKLKRWCICIKIVRAMLIQLQDRR